jgi:hypothetical protein
MSKTNLGLYLYSVRVRRGYEGITDYLKKYTKLPISETYYRDIESGRKKIKIETAEKLCNSLKLDQQEFYYHFIKDVLPPDVFKKLLKHVETTTFNVASEEIDKLQQNIDVLRRAYEKKLLDDIYEVGDEIVDYLDSHFELLPLIHFIYMKESCTFSELTYISQVNNISIDLHSTLIEFQKHHIANINFDSCTVSRFSTDIRMPRNEKGIELKDRFLVYEINETLKDKTRGKVIGPNSTFQLSRILCMKTDAGLTRVSNKILDVIAELDVAHSSLDEPNTMPYFVSIVCSSRENYRCKNDYNLENRQSKVSCKTNIDRKRGKL